MRIIRDLQAAKSLLGRPPFENHLSPALRQRVKEVFGEELTLEQTVERIIEEVRTRGDAALFDYSKKIDGVELDRLEVTKDEIAESYRAVDEELLRALTLAAERVRSFHLIQKRSSRVDFIEGELGQRVRPLERVGLYAPGGTASYPSTVLMTAIPAKVAGVTQVILTTPPKLDGIISPPMLVAADIARVDRVFKVGGAQAIAALAFGTQSVPSVDKVCGPGNIFVMLAKKKVYGVVDIDGLQGPTETVVLADDSASPLFCALDLLAQAEHDVAASAIMLTTSPELAAKVSQEIERQLLTLERGQIARESLNQKGGIVIVDSIDQAIDLVNSYAPEHLCLMVRDAGAYLSRIVSAGGIYVGQSSPEALGDYVAGPSHVMPTGGTARWSSPLSVDDFLKTTSLVALKEEALKALGPAAAAIARAEGLTAHARAVEARLKSSEES